MSQHAFEDLPNTWPHYVVDELREDLPEYELKIKATRSEKHRLQLALASEDLFFDVSEFREEFRKYLKCEESNPERVEQLYEKLCELVAKYEDLVE